MMKQKISLYEFMLRSCREYGNESVLFVFWNNRKFADKGMTANWFCDKIFIVSGEINRSLRR